MKIASTTSVKTFSFKKIFLEDGNVDQKVMMPATRADNKSIIVLSLESTSGRWEETSTLALGP